jgi:hypothetical protein
VFFDPGHCPERTHTVAPGGMSFSEEPAESSEMSICSDMLKEELESLGGAGYAQ